MALRESKAFVVVTSTMVVLALLSFALRVYVHIASGHGLATYASGKGIPWNYISAAVTLGAISLVLVAWALISLSRRLRDRKRARGAS